MLRKLSDPRSWGGTVTRALSPGGSRARHQILIFHRVLERPDPLLPGDPSREEFAEIVEHLKDYFAVLPLSDALELLRHDRLPRNSISITFDDGYADNYQQALPVLEKAGVAATFFVATAFLDGGRMWNDSIIELIRSASDGELDLSHLGLGAFTLRATSSRQAVASRLISAVKHLPPKQRFELVAGIEELGEKLPTDIMMTSKEVRGLADAGMEIGGHTRSHPILKNLDDATAGEEIAGGKEEIEAIVGKPVTLFAYPNGKYGMDFDDRDVDLVRSSGFEAAVTTDPGVSSAATDAYRLPRFTPWRRDPGRFSLDLLRCRLGLL